jgi:hypothetical protein
MKTKQTKSAEIRSILSQLKQGDSVAIPVWGKADNHARSTISIQAKALGITVTSSLSPNRKFLTVSRPVVAGPPKEEKPVVGAEWVKLDADSSGPLKKVPWPKRSMDLANQLFPPVAPKPDPALAAIQKRLEKAKASVKFYEDLLLEAKGA